MSTHSQKMLALWSAWFSNRGYLQSLWPGWSSCHICNGNRKNWLSLYVQEVRKWPSCLVNDREYVTQFLVDSSPFLYVRFCFLGGGEEGPGDWFSLSEYSSMARFRALVGGSFWPSIKNGRLPWCDAAVHVHLQLQVCCGFELLSWWSCGVWKLEDWNGLRSMVD